MVVSPLQAENSPLTRGVYLTLNGGPWKDAERLEVVGSGPLVAVLGAVSYKANHAPCTLWRGLGAVRWSCHVPQAGPGMSPRLDLKSLLGLFGLWLALRIVFFEGLWGYDDLYHVNWAVHPRVPVDVWEARLLFNGLLWVSHALFGFSEAAFSLPTMLGSLMILGSALSAAGRLLDGRAALLAGFGVAILAGDILRATDPMANPLSAGFASVGIAALLTSPTLASRRAAVAGVALGLSVYTHLATLFAVLPIVAAWALAERTRARALAAAFVLCVAGATSVVLELGVMGLVSGDPLLHPKLLSSTHLQIQQYIVPPHLPDGTWNPEWFTWPFQNLILSKDFGLFLSLPVGLALLRWRALSSEVRFLVGCVLLGWFWLSFGTQHPLGYAPLDHQTRYWHALAMPGVVLAVAMYRTLSGVWTRRGYVAALVVPMPLILLGSGSWGQNVEVSRTLLAYAQASPERVFVTDPYTYDEMYVLVGCAPPPANVRVPLGLPEPEFHKPPRSAGVDLNSPDLAVLVNVLNYGRVRSEALGRLVETELVSTPIGEPAWRHFARLLPDDVRAQHPWMMRHPAPTLAVRRPSLGE
jgi:hypothetical protein